MAVDTVEEVADTEGVVDMAVVREDAVVVMVKDQVPEAVPGAVPLEANPSMEAACTAEEILSVEDGRRWSWAQLLLLLQ